MVAIGLVAVALCRFASRERVLVLLFLGEGMILKIRGRKNKLFLHGRERKRRGVVYPPKRGWVLKRWKRVLALQILVPFPLNINKGYTE